MQHQPRERAESGDDATGDGRDARRPANLQVSALLTLCSTVTSPLVGPDRDRPSASSIKATKPFQAAIGIALLVDIIRATSDFIVEPRATCEPWVKHTCLDEQDDCERVGSELQSKPTRSYADRTVVFRPSYR